MFSKKTKTNSNTPTTIEMGTILPSKSAIPSIIASDLHISGDLASNGNVEIQGLVDGNITCSATVTVRDSGVVKGDIVADTVQVDGEIRGLVKAKHVKISSTGKIIGVLMYESLSIEDGAFIDGQCKCTEQVHADNDMKAIDISQSSETEKKGKKSTDKSSIKLVSDNDSSSAAH